MVSNWLAVGLVLSGLTAQLPPTQEPVIQPSEVCETTSPTIHTARAGETTQSVASQYGLTTATLLGANPQIRNRPVRKGDKLTILPRDGILYKPVAGEGFPEVASRFNTRADVLFELNGCQMQERLFVPGVRWQPPPPPAPPSAAPAPPVLRQLPPPPILPAPQKPPSKRRST